MKYLGYFSKLMGMRSKLSKHGEIATATIPLDGRDPILASLKLSSLFICALEDAILNLNFSRFYFKWCINC